MNTSKQVNVMIGLLFMLLVVLFGYLAYEGTRQDRALEEVTKRNAERGARLFVQNCRTCHGLEGLGPEDHPAGFGAKLNTPAYLILGEDNVFALPPTSLGEADGIRAFLADTITCGRSGTFMPPWSEAFGGPLSDTQINHLVTMITNVRWDLVEEIGDEVDEENGLSEQEIEEIVVSDPSALAVTQSNCGQYTGAAAQSFRARDPLAAPGAAATAAPAPTTIAPPPGAEVVVVQMAEFSITPAVDAAGDDITFRVANDGVGPHEFTVIRSDLAVDALPMGAGVADESQLEVVGRVAQWPGGETRDATFTMTPGRYILICNLPGHYQLGMTAAFTVE